MSCKYSLLFLFLCGFAALSDSVKTCGKELLEGTSCTIKLEIETNKSPDEIKWFHETSETLILRWKEGAIKKIVESVSKEDDGSLTFKSVSLNDTGKYKYEAFNKDGTEIVKGVKEIKVFAKAPKPTVKANCKNGEATLTCDIGDRKDLNVSWYKENEIIKNEEKSQLVLTSAKVQENKPYSCKVSNPVSTEQSDSFTVTCTGGTSDGSGRRKLFGFDFWIMVSILAGGGTLLLLLICVLIICACRSCKKQKNLEQDEDELRLRVFHDPASNGTARSKNTARGQPAPPIPQVDTSPDTPPPQTQPQPKAQIRARPPPPPEDDDEYPPPLPRPRNKQHRKRNEEPYRPME
ncbi:T-cell surface antigen CD2-like isoform X1 [Labeo rohita]|uniref:T-cell surface antigen CD2-like isoform X1 n=1 Tax=Labeo rohita TaxID=84645 RepID=A0A498P5J9_LABRO|nr:T-cell surface antigen CD2-like isoform X1 [Labeo rohita]RXN38814.1 T-cell surface antigen CD2-like isoform X1 [Labeo rohita]